MSDPGFACRDATMPTVMKATVLVSCEHATCAVPGGQRALFEGREDELHSEAGWEPGALNLGQSFAMAFRTPIIHGEITRLLIDLEADETSRWGKYAENLPAQTRERFAENMWGGYRNTLYDRIAEDLQRHDVVVHLLAHVTTVQPGHVGLRIPQDSLRAMEIAQAWAVEVEQDGLKCEVATGSFPGNLVEHLSSRLNSERYVPIRLEVASTYFLEGQPMRWEPLKKRLIQGLQKALDGD